MKPLSERARPKNINEFIGQTHLLGENGPITTMMLSKNLFSMIFYGPTATGKTTLANILAQYFNYPFIKSNALSLNSKELNTILNSNDLESSTKRILFIDEFYRLNKPKQDMLLAPLEKGEIIIIGATTENPFFVLQKALRSRVLIFEFKELNRDEIEKIIINAIKKDVLLSKFNIDIEDRALSSLLEISFDVRKSLNILELVILSRVYSILQKNEFYIKEENFEKFLLDLMYNEKNIGKYVKNKIKLKEIDDILKNEKIKITEDDINLFTLKKETKYSDIEDHYNVISAFIKSIRGSDPDAAIYYLALMLESGEDPVYIARRLIILAAEDIGLAYPEALSIAVSGLIAIERIGMPEARIIISEITILLSTLPKSNSSYLAINKATEVINSGKIFKIPDYLKSGGYKLYKKSIKNYKDATQYKYPHNYKNHWVRQKYLEEDLKLFEFQNNGFEIKLKNWIKKIKSDIE